MIICIFMFQSGQSQVGSAMSTAQPGGIAEPGAGRVCLPEAGRMEMCLPGPGCWAAGLGSWIPREPASFGVGTEGLVPMDFVLAKRLVLVVRFVCP